MNLMPISVDSWINEEFKKLEGELNKNKRNLFLEIILMIIYFIVNANLLPDPQSNTLD